MPPTIPLRLLSTADVHGSVVAIRTEDGDAWTYRDLAARVAAAAGGFAWIGVRAGDRVALMMRNRPEFHVADTALQFLGAIPYSLYLSASADEVAYATGKAGTRLAVIEGARLAPRFAAAGGVDLVAVDDAPSGARAWSEIADGDAADLAALAATVAPDTPATIIFTSGTTGPAKAVVISQANVCAAADTVHARTGLPSLTALTLISYLPMAHIAERLVSHYAPLAFGLTVHPLADIARFNEVAQAVQPHIMFGVPRVWEKIQQGVLAAISADPGQAKAFDDGVAAARELAAAARAGPLTEEQQATWDFLDQVAFAAVRRRTGLANVVLAVSGAAPISSELVDWFQAIRVPLSEIYGMSESTGVISWEAQHPRPGTVGRPLDGLDVAIADDGEVMVRGPVVFAGYLDEPDKTAETVQDGWLHTGDIGTLDEDGFLRIVDRKKELIITAGGENVSPGNLEVVLKGIPLVGDVCVVGDRQKFPAALVTLDVDEAPRWAAAHGLGDRSLAELADDPTVRQEIQRGLDEVNRHFTRAYQVKRFVVLPDQWQADNELMTPTFKLKRRGIAARYAEEIAALYADS